jgi:hypothetical protein
MNIVISYSLFDQFEDKFNRNGHDPFDKKPYRYWLNLPSILIVNNIVFPNSITRIYIPKLLQNNKYYSLLEEFKKELDFFELEIIDKPYKKTEPSIWRVEALWDKKANFVFCRDLDSLMIKKEAHAMQYFINSKYMINNIRSARQHNGEGTSIMAGLCGFNIPKLHRELPMPENFEKYLEFYKKTTKPNEWGCDQETLINFFLRYRSNRVANMVLDTYIQPRKRSKNIYGVKPNKYYQSTSIAENTYNNIKLSVEAEKILTVSDSFSNWAGEPINASGNNFKKILTIAKTKNSKIIEKIIKSNNSYIKLFSI